MKLGKRASILSRRASMMSNSANEEEE